MNTDVWGKTKDGEDVVRYTLRNKNITAQVMNLGGTLLSLSVPDKNGVMTDVVLGYDSCEDYFDNSPYFGCNVLPNANRIGGAAFSLNGQQYTLDKNDGENNLHSGFDTICKKIWNVDECDESSISFSYEKRDGDNGLPGNCRFVITYILSADATLTIRYVACSDADTVFNPTNHSYFNLNGQGNGDILEHTLQIDADSITYAGSDSICTGELVSVENTPFDFRVPHTIGERIGDDNKFLGWARGYDHNFCLNGSPDMNMPVATLASEKSGISMDIYTDMPGIQVYTGNYISRDDIGKGKVRYDERFGVALETQYYPNAVNVDSFESPIIKAGETVEHITVFKFS